jgi:hypothetical protein
MYQATPQDASFENCDLSKEMLTFCFSFKRLETFESVVAGAEGFLTQS